MKYGYIRSSKGAVSATDQKQTLQAVNCDKLVEEEAGGKDRSEFLRLTEMLQAGDVVSVTSLDRLGSSLPQLLTTLAELLEKGADVQSLKEKFDTRQFGEVVDELSMLLRSLVASERGFLVERIQAGRANMMRKGVKLGRRSKLTADQVVHARHLLGLGEGGRAVARTFGVSEATLYRALRTTPAVM